MAADMVCNMAWSVWARAREPTVSWGLARQFHLRSGKNRTRRRVPRSCRGAGGSPAGVICRRAACTTARALTGQELLQSVQPLLEDLAAGGVRQPDIALG